MPRDLKSGTTFVRISRVKSFCLRAQGRYQEALPFAEKALRLGKAEFGLDHPTTAMSTGSHDEQRGWEEPSGESRFKQGETDMGDKGKKDKGKREQQKKAQLNLK